VVERLACQQLLHQLAFRRIQVRRYLFFHTGERRPAGLTKTKQYTAINKDNITAFLMIRSIYKCLDYRFLTQLHTKFFSNEVGDSPPPLQEKKSELSGVLSRERKWHKEHHLLKIHIK
jgi:hypothetical protein